MTREVPPGHRARYEHGRNVMFLGGQRIIQPTGGRTRCEILDGEGSKVAEGVAWCGPADNYSKKIGRAIALGRALKSMGVPR